MNLDNDTYTSAEHLLNKTLDDLNPNFSTDSLYGALSSSDSEVDYNFSDGEMVFEEADLEKCKNKKTNVDILCRLLSLQDKACRRIS